MYDHTNGVCLLFPETTGKSIMPVSQFFGGFRIRLRVFLLMAGWILQCPAYQADESLLLGNII
jgi:hypothetical protein